VSFGEVVWSNNGPTNHALVAMYVLTHKPYYNSVSGCGVGRAGRAGRVGRVEQAGQVGKAE
jgi:hypothetical protein